METTTEAKEYFAKLQLLREKLGQKAKQEPKFRFYTLYAHLLREDMLQLAWQRVRQNGGAPGIDGVTFEQIEGSEGGIERFLQGIHESLANKTYRASLCKESIHT